MLVEIILYYEGIMSKSSKEMVQLYRSGLLAERVEDKRIKPFSCLGRDIDKLLGIPKVYS